MQGGGGGDRGKKKAGGVSGEVLGGSACAVHDTTKTATVAGRRGANEMGGAEGGWSNGLAGGAPNACFQKARLARLLRGSGLLRGRALTLTV